jgi:hypothetical protein
MSGWPHPIPLDYVERYHSCVVVADFARRSRYCLIETQRRLQTRRVLYYPLSDVRQAEREVCFWLDQVWGWQLAAQHVYGPKWKECIR